MQVDRSVANIIRLFAGFLIVMTVCSGCVRRRLTIRTSPPGALVSVDNQVVGTTPAASAFTYYAPRDIRIEKEGFKTQTIRHRIDPPWYQFPPLDFITETLWPGEIRDERIVDVQLTPEEIEPVASVVGRADQLRLQSRQGVVPSIYGAGGTAGTGGAVPFSPPIVDGSGSAIASPAPSMIPPPVTQIPAPATPIPAPATSGSLPPGGIPYQITP